MYRNMAPNVATQPTPLIDYIRAGSRSTVGMDFGIFILFYFSILIVCRSPVAHLHFFSILQFYFHRTVVRPAAICSDFTTYSCAVFDSSLTHICSCAVNGISIKCAICLCPRGATLLILQSSIPPIPNMFAHTYLMLLCSQRRFDQMRHMSLPARCYPFNPAIVNPANT